MKLIHEVALCRFESYHPVNAAVDVPQVTCKSLSLAYWRQAHEYLCVLRGHFKKIMNEKEIKFCYIANRQHGSATITEEQLRKIKYILYGEEKV